MNDYMESMQKRLEELFENKAAEFTRYSEENPHTAPVTSQIAGMYEDLARVWRG